MNHMFCFLLALTAVLAATANARIPLVDTDGDFISADHSYYLVPDSFGGGLTLTPSDENNQCPLYIGIEKSMDERGIPIIISNWGSGDWFATESENLNIEMDIKATTCGQSTYWWVTEPEGDRGEEFIVAGPKPETGKNSTKSFFQIENDVALRTYNIMFCPNGNDHCRLVGVDLSLVDRKRLAVGLDYSSYSFAFVKATKKATKSII